MPIRITDEQQGADQELNCNPFLLPDADPSVEQKPEGISFCMIMRNEEQFLEQCILSVRDVVDEICIVDTGSTDRSIEIAKKYGARILETEWPNHFSKARNMSLEMATFRWILTLDADEELSPDSLSALRQIRHAPADRTALSLRILNRFNDGAGESICSHFLPRLFPNNEKIRYIGAIHERVCYDETQSLGMVDSPITIIHHGYQKHIIEEREKTKRNLPLIEKDVEENPDNLFCIFNLAMLQISIDKIEEGIASFEKLFASAREKKIGFGSAYFPPAFLALAQTYFELNGDFEKAFEVLDEAIEAHPHYPNTLFFKGNLHLLLGQIDKAKEYLKRAADSIDFIRMYAFVDEEIPVWRAKFHLALTYASTGDYDEAFAWFDRAILARPKVFELRASRARTFEAAGRLAEAERSFEELYREFGGEQALSEYLRCLMRMKKYSKAMLLVNSVRDKVMSDRMKMEILLTAASAAHSLGLIDAEDYLSDALAIQSHPMSGTLIHALETLYRSMGMNSEAQELREWELKEEPICLYAEDFARRSFRWIEEGNFERAAKIANAGLKIYPINPYILFNAGLANSRIGEVDAAITHFSKLAPYPEKEMYVKGHYLSAILLRNKGRREDALSCIDSLLKCEVDQPDALVFRGTLLAQLGRIEEAENALKYAAQWQPREAAVELATMYLQAGRYQEAHQVAEAALIETVNA